MSSILLNFFLKKIKFLILILLFFLTTFCSKPYPLQTESNSIFIEAESFFKEDNGNVRIQEDRPGTTNNTCILGWNNDYHAIYWEVNVPETNNYKIIIRYASGRNWNITRSIKIDDEFLHYGLKKIILRPTGGFGRNESEWKNYLVAYNNKPVLIRLKKGKHILKIINNGPEVKGENHDGAGNFDLIAFINNKSQINAVENYITDSFKTFKQEVFSNEDITEPLEQSKQVKLTLNSTLLKKKMKMRVYLPKGYNNKTQYPALYLIHGFGGDENSWLISHNLDKKLDQLYNEEKLKQAVIVCPQMDKSFGFNSSKEPKEIKIPPDSNNIQFNLGRYEDYFIKEVIPFVESSLSISGTKENRYIGGISMGGYIALHMAFKFSDIFSKAGGHSAALAFVNAPPEMAAHLKAGEDHIKKQNPAFIAKDKKFPGLKIYMDCSDEDQLFNYNKELYDLLKQRGENVEFHSGPGGHMGGYWQQHIEEYCLFYLGK